MKTGPNIQNNGLVFAYDTGEFSSNNPNKTKFSPAGKGGRRFFKGKSSINYAAFKNAVPQSSYSSYAATTSGTWVDKHPGSIRVYNAQGTDISYSSNSGVGDWTNTYHAYWTYDNILKKPVIQMNAFDSNWKAKSFGVGMSAWNAYGVSAGDKYVISWLQWTSHIDLRADVGLYTRNTAGSNGFHDGRQSPRNIRTNRWERKHAVYTVSSNRDLTHSQGSIYMYGHTTSNGSGKVLKIANVQIEIDTDYPSEYLDSISTAATNTRSSTQSLIDLKKTTTLNTDTISFDSSGFPTFDGTDDYLTIAGSTDITSDAKTIEIAFKMNGSYSNFSPLAVYANGSSSTNRIWLGLQKKKFRMHGWGTDDPDGTTTISADEWYICTFSYNKSTQAMKMYTNGVLESSTTNSQGGVTASSSLNWYIGTVPGGWQSVTYSNVNVPIFKIYNRILSDSEVKQNFNAYRKRFGI